MTHRAYRFGDYRLDPATRVLARGDEPVALPSKAFDCLVYLIENRSRAVGRDELIAAVWGKVDIGDNVLGQTVLFARRAIEDTGKEQHAIRTIVRYGYHWVAPIEIETVGEPATAEATPAPSIAPAPVAAPAPAAPPPPAPAASPAPIPIEPRRRLLLPALALGATALVAAFAWQRWREPAPAPVASVGANLLVLPATVTGDDESSWVRLGVMDLVASRLRAAGLAVVPSDNVVALARGLDGAALKRERLEDLTDTTGAQVVVDAQAERIGDAWRIALRTVHGREPPIDVQETSPDLLGAARVAADRLAQRLGGAPAAADGDTTSEPAFAALLQQVDAAMLSDRLDAAQALLERATPQQRERPETRLRLAQIHYQAGRFDAARSAFTELAASVSAEQDPVVHARAIYGLGVLAMIARDPATAMPRFNAAVALLQGRGVPAILGRALAARASAHATQNDFDASMTDLAAARVAYESADDGLALAVLDANVGAFELLRDRPAEAAAALDRAIARFAAFRMHAAELNARDAAAHARLMLLDPRAALALEARMHELGEQVADPQRRATATLTRVEILAANGQTANARVLLDAVRAAGGDGADPAIKARADAIAARLALADGDAAQAATLAAAALISLPDNDDTRQAARARLTLLRAQLASGGKQDAAASVAAIAEWARRVATPGATTYAKLAQAEAAASANAPDAGTQFEAALAAADQNRIPIDLVAVAQGYTRWLATHLDPVRAGVLAERLGAWADHDYDAALLQLTLYHALGQNAAWRSALDRCRRTAGERAIPAALAQAPSNRL
ncbi:winged helix-turn-helix domain-containing protein [Tahibacter soli]|uniref:Winged helix-turn-helix domain-containing protein n=1 Tax=Tahibacter soli TaxID=2983605 RepID=A0A9X3YI74_9GAMM|nr:winged helix-turn-helix domain-containing protein [Tahibacter soli]MDC8012667.1 winged helix-turn-helix domain-containing protein [Tahibacter soli]